MDEIFFFRLPPALIRFSSEIAAWISLRFLKEDEFLATVFLGESSEHAIPVFLEAAVEVVRDPVYSVPEGLAGDRPNVRIDYRCHWMRLASMDSLRRD